MARFAVVFILGLCYGVISVNPQFFNIQKPNSLHKQISDTTRKKAHAINIQKPDSLPKPTSDTIQVKTDTTKIQKSDSLHKQTSDTTQVKKDSTKIQKTDSLHKQSSDTILKKALAINIQKLDSLNKLTLDQFDTYITSHGYLFFKSLPTEKYGEAVLYAYKQNDSTLKAEYFIKKYLNAKSSGQKVISFQTNYVSEYLSLKKDLVKGGFVEAKTETSISPELSITYTNEKIKATVVLSIYVSSGTKKTNIYEITLIQN